MLERSIQRLGWAALLVTGALAQAQAELSAEKADLRPREECLLRAVAEDGRTWRWRLQGPATFAEILRPLSSTTARFTAPPTGTGGSFTVVLEDAQNPSIRAECELKVAPGRAPSAAGDAFLPGSFRPAVSTFLGDPTAPAQEPGAAMLRFSGEAFGQGPLRRLNRCWFVAGGQGLQAYDSTGAAVAIPGPRGAQAPVAALALRPPGREGGPALVYGLAMADGETRIFTLEADGSHRPWAFAGAPAKPLRDLALDGNGNLFAAFCGDRRLWRLAADGKVSIQAQLAAGGGILALVQDPASGAIYLGDGAGVHRVAGDTVSAVLTGLRAAHLALHGRELLVVDPVRPELRVWHLDSRRTLTLVAGQERADARLGPLPALNPDLPPERCALLAACGPVTSNQGGMVLLGLGGGLAILDLPPGAITRPAHRPGAATGSAGSVRQQRLQRSRTLQLETRRYKQEQRQARQAAARPAELEAARPAEPAAPRSRCAARPSPGGLFCLTLLGLGSLSDPALLGALAQNASAPPFNLTAQIHRYGAQAQGGLEQLRLACASPLLLGRDAAPCAADYGTGVATQVGDLEVQMLRLFVDPEVLGAGSCLPGEPPEAAKTRIALQQSDLLADYDSLSNGATSLEYQLIRDSFGIGAVADSLLAGQAGAIAVGAGMSGISRIPAFVLGEVGHSLASAGFAIRAVGSSYGKASAMAITYKAKYLRWALKQTPALVADCRGRNQTGVARPVRAAVAESPLDVFADAVQKLSTGCALAGQHGLTILICSEESLAELAARKDTLAGLQASLPCLVSGFLATGAPRGAQAACPRGSLVDDAARSDTFAYFGEFLGEASMAGFDAITLGNALIATSEGLVIAGNAAVEAGSVPAGAGQIAGAATLVALSNGIFADGYDLLRIAARAGSWVADLTRHFNADSLRQLEAKERAAAQNSSTGAAAPGTATLLAAPAASAALPAASAASGPTPAETTSAIGDSTRTALPLSASAAASARPISLRGLLNQLLTLWSSAPAAHPEL